MEIKIQYKNRVFSLCFGKHIKWFKQIYFFSITEEFYDGDNLDCNYAKLIYGK